MARELGLPVTTHAGVWGATNDDGIRLMHENGFATPETVYVHAATLSADSYQRIAASGGSVSVATESEQSAGQGYPPTWQLRKHGIPVSLSMDTSVWWSSDLFSAMRTTLGADRSREHMEAHEKGDTVTHHRLRAEQVVEWATRGGAAVLGRSDLGSLEPGKKADVVLIKNDASPVSFPMLNPYGQIAFQAQRGDVHTVLVDGRIVKQDGKLVGVDLPDVRRRVDATVDYLRSTMGEEAWAAGMNPRPARRRAVRQPLPVHRLRHRHDAEGLKEDHVAGRGAGPDFVESLARGLDVLACFGAHHRTMTLTEVAAEAGLARPTARRLLLTLEELGFVTSTGGTFALTPEGAQPRCGVRQRAGAVGHRPAAPGEAGDADRRVVVDGAARRLRHRLRRAGLGAEDHRAAGGDRHPLPGSADLAGQGAARRAAGRRAGTDARGAEPRRPPAVHRATR